MRRRSFIAATYAACLAFPLAAPALADTSDPCRAAGFTDLGDRPSVVGTPCVVPRAAVVFETGYYQNASEVGGTALAAYPTVRLRTGLARAVELFVDAPNAVAKSGAGGRGVYTSEQAGYGVKWLLGGSSRISIGMHGEITPPNPATSIMDAKERYETGVESLYRVTPSLDLATTIDLDDGRRYGRQIRGDAGIREGISLRYSLSNSTHVEAEFATEDGSRHGRAAAHSMGDVVVRRALAKRVLFDVEVGTAIDTIRGGSKPHYLGAGLSFR